MNKFSMETPVLTGKCEVNACWICREFVDAFFEVPKSSKISIRLTNYPLKEAVKVCLQASLPGTFWWFVNVWDCPHDVVIKRGNMYSKLAEWLNTYSALKALKYRQSKIVYISIYIHG